MVRKTSHSDIALYPVRVLRYPYPLSTVFPQAEAGATPRRSSISSLPQPGNGGMQHEDDLLDKLLVLDYRYSRYVLDPRSGLFSMVRFVNI